MQGEEYVSPAAGAAMFDSPVDYYGKKICKLLEKKKRERKWQFFCAKIFKCRNNRL